MSAGEPKPRRTASPEMRLEKFRGDASVGGSARQHDTSVLGHQLVTKPSSVCFKNERKKYTKHALGVRKCTKHGLGLRKCTKRALGIEVMTPYFKETRAKRRPHMQSGQCRLSSLESPFYDSKERVLFYAIRVKEHAKILWMRILPSSNFQPGEKLSPALL